MTGTSEGPVDDRTLSGLIEWIGNRFASQPALLYKPSLRTEVWTYKDLCDRADRVAHWLQKQGVGKGDRVALWAPNSPWWVAAFFGILRNGSIVVPLDVRSSPDFVDRVIGQSEPSLTIASGQAARHWSFSTPVFAVEDLHDTIPSSPPPALPEVLPDDLAEIVFTSGTTGAPKGVMLSHWNIRSDVEAAFEIFPSGPNFEPLSILPLSHLLEQTVGLLLPLRGGARIAYATALQPAAIQRDMAEYRVTIMVLVPRILSMFMDAIERKVEREGKQRVWNMMCRISEHLPRRARRILFRSVIQQFGGRLDFMVAGGAPLEPELEHKWELMGIAIMQGYGATETSPIVTASTLGDRTPRSVGKAIPGTEVIVAEDGEILVKGPNVMQGYWRNPEATATALAGGYYNTGDLGELDAEGRLFLKGRKKNMIVLANGLNVFPEDVEEALTQVPGVKDAVVIAVPSSYGPQIHAVLLCAKDADVDAIVKQANAGLAPHQHIRSYERWPDPDFPRTHTLKVKRPEVERYVLAERRGEKGTQVQPTLQPSAKPTVRHILSEVIGRPAEEITAEQKLEDLGLDAVSRLELERAVENRLGKFIDDSKIVPETTVGDLEELVSSENPGGEHPYPLWPFSRRIRRVRSLLQAPILGTVDAVNRPQVVGEQSLEQLPLPAIFVMEYESYLDVPFVFAALPSRIRKRVGISTTWNTSHESRWQSATVELLFNSFRYPAAGALHAALVHASGLLDHGWSVLFLLRGDPSKDGQVRSMGQGITLLAREFDLPIVPIRVIGLEGKPDLFEAARRRSVTVEFGEPIVRQPATSDQGVEAELVAAIDPSPSAARR